jgi:CDP-6-deoxy-D-xylo-4-hexulose-3-dehydrase
MNPQDALRQKIAALVDEYAALALAPQPFTPGTTPVPPSGKVIGATELKNMVEASLDGWLTTGRFNAEFEQKLAAFIGIKHPESKN